VTFGNQLEKGVIRALVKFQIRTLLFGSLSFSTGERRCTSGCMYANVG
jgi:hypothetical protein